MKNLMGKFGHAKVTHIMCSFELSKSGGMVNNKFGKRLPIPIYLSMPMIFTSMIKESLSKLIVHKEGFITVDGLSLAQWVLFFLMVKYYISHTEK